VNVLLRSSRTSSILVSPHIERGERATKSSSCIPRGQDHD
jgi:hypothetical protein